MCVLFCISWQKRMVWTTHHGCYFSSSVVVDAGQHQRRQEEEEGAGSRVNQVLQEETETEKIILDSRCASVLFLFHEGEQLMQSFAIHQCCRW